MQAITAPPVWVRFLATIDPTPADRTTYHADSVWQVPTDRAAALVAAERAEYCDAPEAVTRAADVPLEFPPQRVRFTSAVPARGAHPAYTAGSEHELPHDQAAAFLAACVAEPATEPVPEPAPTHEPAPFAAELTEE